MSQSGLVTEEQSAESCGNATAAISGGWAASREGQPQPALPQVRCQGTRAPAATRADTTGESVTEVCSHRPGRDWITTSPSCSEAWEKKAFPHKLLLPQGNLWTTASHIPPSFPPSPHSARSASSPAGQCSAQPFELLYIQQSSKAAICRKLMSCKQRCSAASLQ